MRASSIVPRAVRSTNAYRHLRGSLTSAVDQWALERSFTRVIRKSKNFGDVTWLGHPIWQNVLDVWSIQEAIYEIQPAVLLETGTNRAGSAMFYASLFDLIGKGRVLSVDVESLHEREHPRAEFLIGDSVGQPVMGRMTEAARTAEGPVMVILDADHAARHVRAELEAYGRLVTSGSLMLVQDGVIDELPSMVDARPGPLAAIREFLPQHPEFFVDQRYNRRFDMTHHPDGWLRRR